MKLRLRACASGTVACLNAQAGRQVPCLTLHTHKVQVSRDMSGCCAPELQLGACEGLHQDATSNACGWLPEAVPACGHGLWPCSSALVQVQVSPTPVHQAQPCLEPCVRTPQHWRC